jgi:hypothetical protein
VKHKVHRLLVAILALLVLGVTGVTAQETEDAEDDSGISGYFRTDTDAAGTAIWFGATHTLGGLDMVSDIYVVGPTGEFDIGPAFTLTESESSSLSINPMVGLVFDFENQNVTTFVPQFYTFLTAGSIYFESWIQAFLNSPFDDEVEDAFYTRNFVLYSLSDVVSVGPQIEPLIDLDGDNSGLTSLPVGGRINLAYGDDNTLGLFLGYELKEDARKTMDDEGKEVDLDGIVGRFTFVRFW